MSRFRPLLRRRRRFGLRPSFCAKYQHLFAFESLEDRRLLALDYGDAPDSGPGNAFGNYSTLSTNLGPSHAINPGLYLGSAVDDEHDATPNLLADGDQNDDGLINSAAALIAGQPNLLDVVATNLSGEAAELSVWLDVDRDGIFTDIERVTSPVFDGANGDIFSIPLPAVPAGTFGFTYVRLRLSTDALASDSLGAATDGEVEDYRVAITGPGDSNRDGRVSFADFLRLQDKFNQSGDWSDGDFNGDGNVSFADFLLLQDHFNDSYFTYDQDDDQPTIIASLVADTGSNSGDRVTSNPAISGSVTDVTTSVSWLKAQVGSGPFIDVSLSEGGEFEFDPGLRLDGTQDGSHVIHFLATDLSGNIASVELPVVLDTTKPIAPSNLHLSTSTDTGLSPVDGITHHQSPVIGGDAEAGAIVNATLDGLPLAEVTANSPWQVPTTDLADGIHSITATATDIAGNVSDVSSWEFQVDTKKPNPGSIVIEGGSEFTATRDVNVSVAASDSESGIAEMSFANNGTDEEDFGSWLPFDENALFTLSTFQGTNWLNVRFRDVAGNVSSFIYDSIKLDTVPPTGGILIANDDQYTTTREVQLDLTANDAVSGVAGMSFAINGNDAADFGPWNPFTSNPTLTLPSFQDVNWVNVKFRDAIGNESGFVSDSIILDTIAPTVDVLMEPDAELNESTIDIDVQFSETVAGVDNSDLILSGDGAVNASIGAPSDVGGNTWRFPISGLNEGDVSASLADDVNDISDVAGNNLAAATWSFLIDQTAPNVSAAVPEGSSRAERSLMVDVFFTERVVEVDASDLELSGTAAANAVVHIPTDAGGGLWRFPVSNLNEGIVDVALAPDVGDIRDGAGNTLSPSTWDFSIDLTTPEVIARTPIDETVTSSSVDVDVTFSETVTSVGSSDLTVAGSAASAATVQSPVNVAGTTWRFPVNGLSDGSVTILLASVPGDIRDEAGNDLLPQNWSFDVDVTTPFIVSKSPDGGTITDTSTAIEVTFSEDVSDVDTSDLVLTGTGATSATIGIPSNIGGNSWAYPVSGLTDGLVSVALAPNANDIRDAAGHDLMPAHWNFSVDATLPTVVARSPVGETITDSFVNIDVTFSEPVFDVDETDLILTGAGGGSADVGAPLDMGGNSWRFPVSGLSNGHVIASIASNPGDIIDAAGNDVTPSPTSWGFHVDLLTVDLSRLVIDSMGIQINGANSADASGRSVSGAGDVNGDGYDDVIVGASFASPNGNARSGASYVVFGTPVPQIVDLESLADNGRGIQINGVGVDDRSGVSVSAAGDVNADGYGDLIVGANLAKPNGRNWAGESYVVFGSPTGQTIELSSLVADGFGIQINGVDENDQSGGSVSGAGDVNGDGYDDLIVGAIRAGDSRGESYVVFGSATPSTIELATLVSDGFGIQVNGIDANDQSGGSVSGAGDVNGDGFADLVIGARTASRTSPHLTWYGETYVVFGSPTPKTVELSTLVATQSGLQINGADQQDFSGTSVSGAGDVNGDGYADVIVGADQADPNGNDGAGETYVVFGSPTHGTIELSTLVTDGLGLQINGVDAADASGHSVSGAGDINGDGYADLIVGATGADPNGITQSGASYVIFGSPTPREIELTTLVSDGGGIQLDGFGETDVSGDSVSAAGDVNGDGYADVIIGASYADPDGRFGAGESYIVFGRRTQSVTRADYLVRTAPGDSSKVAIGTTGDGTNAASPDSRVWIDFNDASDTSGVATTQVTRYVDSTAAGISLIDSDATLGEIWHLSTTRTNLLNTSVVFSYLEHPIGGSDEATLQLLQSANGQDWNPVSTDTSLIERNQLRAQVDDLGYFTVARADWQLPKATLLYTEGPVTTVGDTEFDFVVRYNAFDGAISLATIDSDNIIVSGPDGYSEVATLVQTSVGEDSAVIDASYRITPAGGTWGINGEGEYTITIQLDQVSTLSGEFVPAGKIGSFVVDLTPPLMTDKSHDGITITESAVVIETQFSEFVVGIDASDLQLGGSGSSETIVGTPTYMGHNRWSFPVAGLSNGEVTVTMATTAGDVVDSVGHELAPIDWTFTVSTSGVQQLSTLSIEDAGFQINGIHTSDFSGRSVSGAGDVNADGYADIVVGADWADPGSTDKAGETYVIFGSPTPTTVELSSLVADGLGIQVNGIDASDQSGASVSGAGDVNGDGYADFIIGADEADPGGKDRAGEAYVVFGSPTPLTIELSTLVSSGLGIQVNGRDAYVQSGISVSGAGDVNGDGYADLFIGASESRRRDERAGESYVVFGSPLAQTIELSTLVADGRGTQINGIDVSDRSGKSVSGAGDVNGDGYADLIIGASGADPNDKNAAGESYIVFGSPTSQTVDLSTLVANSLGIQINGDGTTDISGESVSGAGDVNGDGYADVILGAYGADPGGNSSSGKSYVVFGSASPQTVELSTLVADGLGLQINGVDADDYSGRSVSGAGDVNGDGYADLIIGAAGADPNLTEAAGESYLVFGYPLAQVLELSTLALTGGGIEIRGVDASDNSGSQVSGAGDVNGDGYADVIIGAFTADPNGIGNAGESYVIFGRPDESVSQATYSIRSAQGDVPPIAVGVTGDGSNVSSPDSRVWIDFNDATDTSGVATTHVTRYDDPAVAGFAGYNQEDTLGEVWEVTSSRSALVATQITFAYLDTQVVGFNQSGLRVLHSPDGQVWQILSTDTSLIDRNHVIGMTDQMGYFTVGLPSAVGGPSATLLNNGGNVTSSSGVTHDIEVQYGDTDGVISHVSIDSDDISVSGPNAFVQTATLVGSTPSTNSSQIDAIYRIAPPGGTWDASDDGEYAISLRGNQVIDNDGLFVVDGVIGSFQVDLTPPTLQAFSPMGTTVPSSATDISVTFSEPITGIDSANLTLSGPGAAHAIVGAPTYAGNNTWRFSVAELIDGQVDVLLTSGSDGVEDLVGNDLIQVPSWSFEARPSLTVGLSTLVADGRGLQINGADADDASGYRVSGAGDVNGDGYADVVVAARTAEPNGLEGSGSTYVVFGASVPQLVELSTLVAEGRGIQINGAAALDYSGVDVSAAGDVNADGFSDIILGTQKDSGASYILFGSPNPEVIELSTLVNDGKGMRINGIDLWDGAGQSVSGAGDVNGDGYADVIVGGKWAAPNGNNNAGESYVIFGSPIAQSIELATLVTDAMGIQINGRGASNYSGIDVAGAGDVNGDGYKDLIVGAYGAGPAGESYIIFGSPIPRTIELSTLVSTGLGIQINGIDANDISGISVQGAGDVNADGLADVIVGAANADPDGVTDAGESYVIFGSRTPQTIDLLSLVANGMGIQINGIDNSDNIGRSVAGAGDVNNDGYADVLVGASRAGRAGESYLVFGSPIAQTIHLSTLGSDAKGIRFDGIDTGDSSGGSVSGVGDMNGDGLPDVIIGASGADPNGISRAGESYVVFGQTSSLPIDLSFSVSTAQGDVPPIAVGVADGSSFDFPDSRVWIDFNDASDASGVATTHVTRYNDMAVAGIGGLNKEDVLDNAWHITTSRTTLVGTQVTFRYTENQIAGFTESDLRVLRSSDGQNWEVLATDMSLIGRNQLRATVDEFSYFTIGLPRAAGSPAATLLDNGGAVNSEGGTTHEIVVRYEDANGFIDVATIDAGDILVTGPNGFSQTAVLLSTSPSVDSATLFATYRFTPPAGSWTLMDSGVYSIMIQNDEVFDDTGVAITPGQLGSFDVALPVVFGDEDLEAAVRRQIGIGASGPILTSDLAGLTQLSADSNLIDSLVGLEWATSLETFNLWPRDWSTVPVGLADLAPISGLTQLRDVGLARTKLSQSDLVPIAGLANLRSLDLRYNEVSDASILLGLSGLESLLLYGNPEPDLSAFAGSLVDVDNLPNGTGSARTIPELSAALHYSPVEIFEWVHNHIDIQLYSGLMKGAQATLETRAGNAWDQAGLLIELLEEAGVSSRYVTGRAALYTTSHIEPMFGMIDSINSGGFFHSAGVNPSGNSIDHAWVEAYLPSAGGTHSWQPMDPSYKYKDFQVGVRDILALVPFDEDTYLSQTNRELPTEFYEHQITQYLSENMPGVSLADVGFDGPIIQESYDAIPTLPYSVSEVTRFDDFAAVPFSWKHSATITLFKDNAELFQQQFALPETNAQRVTISYDIPANAQAVVDSYGGLKETPAGAIQVIPQLKLDGTLLASASPIDWRSIVELHVDLDGPGPRYYDGNDGHYEVQRRAGQFMMVGLDGQQTSDELLANKMQAVLDANIDAANGLPFDSDDQIGGLHSLAYHRWLQQFQQARESLADVGHFNRVEYSGWGLIVSEQYGDYYPDLIIPFVPEGSLIDLRSGGFYGYPDPIRGESSDETWNSYLNPLAWTMSTLEHDIWEELINTEAISTVKSLQLANEQGIPIFEIDSSNATVYIPQLNQSSSIVASVQQQIDSGSTVTIPRDPTPVEGWNGVGWRATGDCLCISGEFVTNGGQAFSTPIEVEPSETEPNFTTAGDPVNIANGSYIHDELDFSIPNIGLPLSFSRHYDSQSLADIGMGTGWVFTYGDYLSFEPDGSVSWHDDRGLQYLFTQDGVGGFHTPFTLHGSLTFDGVAYTYRHKNGFVHKFDLSGRLTLKSDRNGNGLTVAYDGNGRIASVADVFDPSRAVTFTFVGDQIGTVSDFTGRTWTYGYGGEHLTSVTSPTDADTPVAVVQYEYYDDVARDGLIKRITAADGGDISFTYYPNGRVFEVTDPLGNTQTFYYSLFHSQTIFVDERDVPSTYSYNDDGNLVKLTHADRTSDEYVWQDGLMQSHTDVFGSVESYSYDSLGNLEQLTNRDGAVTDFAYEPTFSNVTTISRPDGRVTQFDHDANGNVIKITDAIGNSTTMTYDSRGLLTTQTQPKGNDTSTPGDYTTTFTYNDAGRVEMVSTDLPSIVANSYDARGNLLATIDANDNTTTLEYDLLGRVTRSVDPLSNETRTTYDAIGNVIEVTNPLGHVTLFEYDLKQDAIRITNPDGTMLTNSFDAVGNLLHQTDELGRATRSIYDARNRKTKTIFADGASVWTEYDGGGRAIANIDALRNRTEVTYDAMGRILSTTDALGANATFTYDALGNLQTSTDQRGGLTAYTYDLSDRVTQVRGEEGFIETTDYDANGNVIDITRYDVISLGVIPDDPRTLAVDLKRSQATNYDVLNRPTEQIDPLGYSTKIEYDAGGRISQTIDERNEATSFQYDEANRLISRTNPDGGIVQYEYDELDRRTRLTMPEGGVWEYEYDNRGRQVAETDPLGERTVFSYDAVGTRLGQDNPDGTWIRNEYDDVNRLMRQSLDDGSYSEFTYDKNGNLLRGTTEETVITFEYDELDRQVNETLALPGDAFNSNVVYEYDAVGNLTSTADMWERTVSYGYDLANRLESVGSTDGTSAHIGFNGFGERASVNYGNSWLDSLDYDGNGKLGSVSYNGPGGSSSIQYDRDEAGNPTTITEAIDAIFETLTITRDEMGRPIAVVAANDPVRSETFAHDGNNNLTNTGIHTGVTIDLADQVQAASTLTYINDTQGNIVSKTNVDGSRVETSHDAANRIRGIREYDQLGTLTRDVSYTYDAIGRRVAISEAGNTTHRIFAFGNMLGKIESNGSAADEITRYVVGPGLDDVFAANVDGANRYLHRDEVGSVRLVTDDASQVVATESYSLYGRPVAQTGVNDTGLGFTARPSDAGTGLIDLRARFYDPELGRFYQQDAVSTLDTGTANNSYVGNQPLVYVDPTGLTQQSPLSSIFSSSGGPGGGGPPFTFDDDFNNGIEIDWRTDGFVDGKRIAPTLGVVGDFATDVADYYTLESVVLSEVVSAFAGRLFGAVVGGVVGSFVSDLIFTPSLDADPTELLLEEALRKRPAAVRDSNGFLVQVSNPFADEVRRATGDHAPTSTFHPTFVNVPSIDEFLASGPLSTVNGRNKNQGDPPS